MSKPGISIIMPCHNYGRYIEEAVESVMKHNREGVPMELIIVDDGSNDGGVTAAALDRIEHSQHPFPVKIVRNETGSGGPSKPRNEAIKLAQYDYICPVDADDRFNNGPEAMKNGSYFARALADFEANPDLAIVYADMHPFDEKGYKDKNTPWGTQPYDEDEMVRHGVIPAFGMYRRADVLASGGYDEQLKSQEDWVNYLGILNSRAARGLGREVSQYDEEYLDYRQHDAGGQGTVKVQARKGTPEEQLEKSKLLYRRLLANAPLLLREHYPNLNWDAKPEETAEEIREHSRDRFNAAASSNPRTIAWYAAWQRWNEANPPQKEPAAQPAPVPQSPA